MEWWLVLSLMIGGLILLMLLGLPVAFSFFAVTIVFVVVFMGSQVGPRQLILSMYDSTTKFSLSPIPFFVIMGEVLLHSGLGARALDALAKWIGAIPGRLSIITLLSGGLFASLSGSTVANTAMLGSLMVPEMRARGYAKSITVGPILASGALAMVIPPSAIAVLLGSLGEVSIGGLLIASIIPGLLLLSLFLIYTIVVCWINPSLAPRYEVESVSMKERLVSSLRDLLPMGFIIFLVLGLIFLGVATPSEAAALGSLGSLVLAALYGGLSLDVIKKSMIGTLKVTVMILTIIAGSSAFSQILAFSGAGQSFVDLMIKLPFAPIWIVVIMIAIVIVMGCFMDQVSIMMITTPIFMPVIDALGFNPIWFLVLILISLEIGQLTPPVGLALFVMKSVAPPDFEMKDIYNGVFPYVITEFVALAILIMVPSIVLWLPNYLS